VRALRELDRGNLDAAQSLASSTNLAQATSKQADETSAQERAQAKAKAAAEQAQQTEKKAQAQESAKSADDAANDREADADAAKPVEPAEEAKPSTNTSVKIAKGDTLEAIAREHYGENWKAGLALMAIDNGLKLNQWGSPVLREGKPLVVNDLSERSPEDLAKLSRMGGNIIAGNSRGLQAKADLEERVRVAAEQKKQEATQSSQVTQSSVVFNAAEGPSFAELSSPNKFGVGSDTRTPQAPTFEAVNNQKVSEGSYSRFKEIGDAVSNGRYGDAWNHATFDASDEARAALHLKMNPPLTPAQLKFQTDIGLAAGGPVLTGLASLARMAGAPDDVVNNIGVAQAGLVMSLSSAAANSKSVVLKPAEPINPLSPVRELDWRGNEVHYRSISTENLETLRVTGKLPATTETSLSPVPEYAQQYDGTMVRFTTKPGTSAQLQQIGIAANEPAAGHFTGMPTTANNWTQNNARFKFESGQMTTQLGQGKALEIYNENMVNFKTLEKPYSSPKLQTPSGDPMNSLLAPVGINSTDTTKRYAPK
jgi:LysM repeat protein